MSWHEITAMGITVRPLTQPIPGAEGAGLWHGSRFKASLSDTLELLARELNMLYAERIILELDVEDRHLRIDGLPRADARLNSQAVALSFDSAQGPLRYATNAFSPWQANLRAIALSLEALRKIDRYGVAGRGQQYRGWRELPTGTDPADAIQTAEQARAFLGKWDGDVRRAVKATHPDHGGDPTEFRKVIRARELVEA